MDERVGDLFDDGRIELGFRTGDRQVDLLSEFAAQVADDAGIFVEHLTDRLHTGRHDAVLDVGNQKPHLGVDLVEKLLDIVGFQSLFELVGEVEQAVAVEDQLAGHIDQAVQLADIDPDGCRAGFALGFCGCGRRCGGGRGRLCLAGAQLLVVTAADEGQFRLYLAYGEGAFDPSFDIGEKLLDDINAAQDDIHGLGRDFRLAVAHQPDDVFGTMVDLFEFGESKRARIAFERMEGTEYLINLAGVVGFLFESHKILIELRKKLLCFHDETGNTYRFSGVLK